MAYQDAVSLVTAAIARGEVVVAFVVALNFRHSQELSRNVVSVLFAHRMIKGSVIPKPSTHPTGFYYGDYPFFSVSVFVQPKTRATEGPFWRHLCSAAVAIFVSLFVDGVLFNL